MAIRKQKGLTLLAVIAAILVGIIIAIGILIWSSSELALANRCQTNLGVLQRHYDAWAQACASNDSAAQQRHLTEMNNIINQWNSKDCKKYGTLPAQPPECPPQQP